MLGKVPTDGGSMTAPSRKRRVTIGVIFALAIIIGFCAVMATWVRREALDSGNWPDTSSKLLADPQIQTAVGGYLVKELFTRVDVAGELRSVLPPEGQALAAPASAGLREVATRLAPQMLQRPRVQDAWRKANETAHDQLLRVLDGGGNTVSTQSGEVTLNLHNLVDELASTLGLQQQVNGARNKLGTKIPPQAGELVIMRSDQLKAAQDIAQGVRHLSIAATVSSLGLFALAVYLARGFRRVALRRVGFSFIGIGVAALLARRVGGNQVVDGLVNTESLKPAVHQAWFISTSLLYTIAVSLIVYGLVLVACAWLAGSTRLAVATRRALAPSLRDRPGWVYAVVGGLYLLVLLWGPTPAFRNLIPILLIAGLLVLGIELLRRQTAREFPDAVAGDGSRAFRGWASTRFSRGSGAGAAPASNGGPDHVAELERLAALHDNGALTDAEFTSEKAALIGQT
jgi:hypothetical protein